MTDSGHSYVLASPSTAIFTLVIQYTTLQIVQQSKVKTRPATLPVSHTVYVTYNFLHLSQYKLFT